MHRAKSRTAGIRLLTITALICGTLSAIVPPSRAGVTPGPEVFPRMPGTESEPNGTAATANLMGYPARVRGSIAPNGDFDYYAFSASTGDRVYAATMTSGSQSGFFDTFITLFASNGTTTLEEDDDNGVFTNLSSSIAGTSIPSDGTYYLRVRSFNSAQQIRPYDLYLHIRSAISAPVSETESNDGTPQTLPPSGWVVGSTSSATDDDNFNLSLDPGDTVVASLDLDPVRDATDWDGRLSLGTFGGNFLGGNDTPLDSGFDSEALFTTVQSAGTYTVRVDAAGSTFGTYHLSVVVISAETRDCLKFSSTDGPKPITDNDTTTSTITVGQQFRFDRLALDIDLSHPNMPDLDLSLQTPAGNEILVMSDIGNSAAPTMNLRLDDAAGLPAGASTLLSGQVLQPELDARLGWTDGELGGGPWTLVMRDDFGTNTGTFNSWSVLACKMEPEPSLPTVYESDFESDDGGFAHTGTADEWQRGLPSFAPITTCNSGTSCWKTDLDNTYDASSSQDLVSPPINLADYEGTILASWAHRFQMDNANVDHFTVTVQEVGGANPRRLFEWDGATMSSGAGVSSTIEESAGWGKMVADISEYAGDNVELRFHLDSDLNTQLAGVAIDDVRVSAEVFHDLTVSKDGTGSGTVTSDVGGIDCGNDCMKPYSDGAVVTLSASADGDSSFGGWSGGGCSGTGTCMVTMDADKTVAATFDDATPPSVPTMTALGNFRTKKKIPLSWNASTDAESGVTSYELQLRTAPPNKPLGPFQSAGSFATTSTSITGIPGDTYCFIVWAVNGEGGSSGSSPEECTSLPLDDRKLKKSSGDWGEKTAKGHYLKTFTKSRENGATLKRTVTAKTLALVATKCPGCGKVAVSFDGDKVKTISLDAASYQKRKVIPLETFADREKGKVKIKIVSNNKPVSIDGLGASAI